MQTSGEQGAVNGDRPAVPLLSVVVPVYNAQEVVRSFQQHLAAILDRFSEETEIIYVNDGSTDSTLAVLHELRAYDPRVAIMDLSRSFGKTLARAAGAAYPGFCELFHNIARPGMVVLWRSSSPTPRWRAQWERLARGRCATADANLAASFL